MQTDTHMIIHQQQNFEESSFTHGTTGKFDTNQIY